MLAPAGRGPLERRIFTAVRRGTAERPALQAVRDALAEQARALGLETWLVVRRPGRARALPRPRRSSSSVSGPVPTLRVSKRSTSSSRLCSSTGRLVAEQDPLASSSSSSTRPVSIAVESSTTMQDLGGGVVVGPRAVDELLELEAADVGHARAAYPAPRSRSWRATSASTSSGSLPRAIAARVAGHDERRGPPRGLRIARRRRPGEPRQLGLDVDRRLAPARRAARCAPRASGGSRRRARRALTGAGAAARRAGAVAVLADRQPAAADLVVQARRGRTARRSRPRRRSDHDEDHDAERVLHRVHCAHVATLPTQDDGSGRPALFPDQWALVLVTALVLIGSIALVVWIFARPERRRVDASATGYYFVVD